VGILVPRKRLGPNYQNFDPSQDIEFGYISSGNTYLGQWVKVPVVVGVPVSWDGSGDYPTAHIEVFAVDRPADFDGGLFGVGFGIDGLADGGPMRNPLLHMTHRGTSLGPGYVMSTRGIEVGLTRLNTEGFAFLALERDVKGEDWLQPVASVHLRGGDSLTHTFRADLPLLIDSGIDKMILWLDSNQPPANLPSGSAFPPGITVGVAAPPADETLEATFKYSFVTGDSDRPMAPSQVEWRAGNGINTGRNVLAGADYLYDAALGRIGFRVPPK
jgi:hypothetical protein